MRFSKHSKILIGLAYKTNLDHKSSPLSNSLCPHTDHIYLGLFLHYHCQCPLHDCQKRNQCFSICLLLCVQQCASLSVVSCCPIVRKRLRQRCQHFLCWSFVHPLLGPQKAPHLTLILHLMRYLIIVLEIHIFYEHKYWNTDY